MNIMLPLFFRYLYNVSSFCMHHRSGSDLLYSVPEVASFLTLDPVEFNVEPVGQSVSAFVVGMDKVNHCNFHIMDPAVVW